MALLNILRYPDARLHKAAAPATVFDDGLKKLVSDMAETMYAAPGIGLAATQVDVHKQVIVIDASERRDSLIVLVNPVILEANGVSDIEEGCLSVPDQYSEVERPREAKIRYLDHENEIREIHATGFLAICLQHEIDHLDGVLFIDRVASLKRNIILRKLVKARKAAVPIL